MNTKLGNQTPWFDLDGFLVHAFIGVIPLNVLLLDSLNTYIVVFIASSQITKFEIRST
jgi:hypothetical protein